MYQWGQFLLGVIMFREALAHFYCLTHPFWQPHHSNSDHALAVSGSNVQSGCQLFIVLLFQPQWLPRWNIRKTHESLYPDVSILVYTTRFLCYNSAACVGGMASMDLALVVKICILAESTLISVHVLSYSSTTYLSNTDMSPSMTFAGLLLN